MSSPNNVGLTQKQIEEAMRGIRQSIISDEMPNTDVLELTERLEDEEGEDIIDPFISILDDALNDKRSSIQGIIQQETIDISQGVVKQFIDAANKKHASEEGKNSALEAIVIEALKPHLSQWLNKHLPEIVRDIVEKEIKKLVP